jgi:mitochondrial fission protein ELM1
LSPGRNKLIIWRYTDGRPGHDSQSLGLCNALGRCVDCAVHDIKPPSNIQALACLLRSRPVVNRELPHPGLIIGAGRQTHLPVFVSKKAVGGKSIVLMRPSLPYTLYDICLVPDHDSPPVLDNVITTAGALNTIVAKENKDPQMGVIMVGGPSKYYSWQDDVIVSVIKTIISKEIATWFVFDSPRTPETTRAQLKNIRTNGYHFRSFEEASRQELVTALVNATNAWVSADSVTMLYEALTAGAPTGIIPVPEKKPNKISSSLEILIYEGQCTPYKEWYDGQPLSPPAKQLHEADRCADIILSRLAERDRTKL